MTRTPASVPNKAWKGELVYVFRNVDAKCWLNPDVYGEDACSAAETILETVTKEIRIDKTYVDFAGTKFEKTFLTETGWNALRRLAYDTNFGVKCTARQKAVLNSTYRQMICGYLEMMFEDLEWDTNGISFDIRENFKIQTEILPDTAEEWRTYPGKWQTWM